MSEATVKLDAIQKAEQRIRNFVHDAVFTDTANAEMRKEGYAGRSLDGGKLNDLMDELKMAVRAVAAGAGDPQGHDVRLAPLEKILAVMRDRTLPDDLALSEIQDYLTIAGYDVPLRSYADQPVGAGDRHPAPSEAIQKAGMALVNHIGNLSGARPTADELPTALEWLTELDRCADALAAALIAQNLSGAVRPTPPGAITVERLAALLAEWDGRDPVDARYEQQVATFQSMAAWLLSRLGAASPAAAPPQEEP